MQDIVVGADVSAARIAYVAARADGELIASTKYVLGPKSGPDVCWLAYKRTRQFIKKVGQGDIRVHAFIEDALVGRGGIKSTKVQAFTNGAVQAAFHGSGAGVQLVNVKTWRKAVVGNGNAPKSDTGPALYTAWADAHEAADGDEDLLDAAAICLYGIGILRIGERLAGGGSLQEPA